MHFFGSRGIERSTLAILRRRRSGLHAHGSLLPLLPSRLRTRGHFAARTVASLWVRAAAVSASCTSHSAHSTLLVSRRFASGSSHAAASAYDSAGDGEPVVSRATRLRHRRGAHRKRGGAAAPPPPSPPSPSSSLPPSPPLVNGEQQHHEEDAVEAQRVVDVATVRRTSRSKRRGNRAATGAALEEVEAAPAAAVAAEQDGEGLEAAAAAAAAGVDDEALDDEAAAIMQQLMAAPKLNGLNGHADTKTVAPPLPPSPPSVAADAAEAAVPDEENSSDVVGVTVSPSKRRSRSRSLKRRRGAHDGSIITPDEPTAASATPPPPPLPHSVVPKVAAPAAAPAAANASSARPVEEQAEAAAAEDDMEEVVLAELFPSPPPPTESAETKEAAAEAAPRASRRARRRGKRGRASPQADTVAEKVAAAREANDVERVVVAGEVAAPPASPQVHIEAEEAAAPDAAAAASNSSAEAEAAPAPGKRLRGRKRRAKEAEVEATMRSANFAAAEGTVVAEDSTADRHDSAPSSTPATATRTAAAAEESGSGGQDTVAASVAALQRLLAARTDGKGGAAKSLAAKKRLAAQLIRQLWQQQAKQKYKESKQHKSNLDAVVSVVVKETAVPRAPATAMEPVAAAAAADGAAAATPQPPARKGKRAPKKASRRRGARATAEAMDAERSGADAAATAGAADDSEALVQQEDDSSQADSSAPQTAAAATLSPAQAAAQDADVMAALAEAAAMARTLEEESEASDGALDGASAAPTPAQDGTGGASVKPSRSLESLVQRSPTIISASPSAKAAKGGSGGSGGSSSSRKGASGGGAGGGSGGKGVNTKDTLYFPDYRERVVQIFEQMAEINNALGERFKSLSYSTSVERLKRGDKVFKLLPPNLLPLPEDSPKWVAPVVDADADAEAAAAVQRRAKEVEENRSKRAMLLSADSLLPGVGHKLQGKIVEILTTGDLKELHVLEAKPLIRAIRELTSVHGFGPRTAIDFYRRYNITTVKELQEYAVKKGELDMSNKQTGRPAGLVTTTGGAARAGFHLNDAQRLGLVYHKDMSHRIPHDEGRLHEAFLKLRLRKYLGKDYDLVVCGSYRRQVAMSGDIDVLLTRRRTADGESQSTAKKQLPPSQVLSTFLDGLKADRYVEATLAQGPTKFMGLCRLRAVAPASAAAAGAAAATAAPPTPRFRARRIDIRYVDASCFPAAMLYFTGSKNFNVIMRSEAIKKHSILNEYGLFRKFTRRQQLQRQVSGGKPYNLHEMITRLARFGFASIKDVMERGGGNGAQVTAEGEEGEGGAEEGSSGGAVSSAGKKIKKKSKEKTQAELAELCEMAKVVERQRIKAFSEKEIFDALDMDYVQPKDRNV